MATKKTAIAGSKNQKATVEPLPYGESAEVPIIVPDGRLHTRYTPFGGIGPDFGQKTQPEERAKPTERVIDRLEATARDLSGLLVCVPDAEILEHLGNLVAELERILIHVRSDHTIIDEVTKALLARFTFAMWEGPVNRLKFYDMPLGSPGHLRPMSIPEWVIDSYPPLAASYLTWVQRLRDVLRHLDSDDTENRVHLLQGLRQWIAAVRSEFDLAAVSEAQPPAEPAQPPTPNGAAVDRQRPKADSIASPTTSASNDLAKGAAKKDTAKPPKEPSLLAKQAYLLSTTLYTTQKAVAQKMSIEYQKQITQGQVSKWIKEVHEWCKTHNLPTDSMPGRVHITCMDSDILDLGARTDGRSTGDPRHRRSDQTDK